MRIRMISPMMFQHYASEDIRVHDAKGKELTVPKGAMMQVIGDDGGGGRGRGRDERWLLHTEHMMT